MKKLSYTGDGIKLGAFADELRAHEAYARGDGTSQISHALDVELVALIDIAFQKELAARRVPKGQIKALRQSIDDLCNIAMYYRGFKQGAQKAIALQAAFDVSRKFELEVSLGLAHEYRLQSGYLARLGADILEKLEAYRHPQKRGPKGARSDLSADLRAYEEHVSTGQPLVDVCRRLREAGLLSSMTTDASHARRIQRLTTRLGLT